MQVELDHQWVHRSPTTDELAAIQRLAGALDRAAHGWDRVVWRPTLRDSHDLLLTPCCTGCRSEGLPLIVVAVLTVDPASPALARVLDHLGHHRCGAARAAYATGLMTFTQKA